MTGLSASNNDGETIQGGNKTPPKAAGQERPLPQSQQLQEY